METNNQPNNERIPNPILPDPVKNNALKSWPQRHRVLWIIIVLAGINIVGGMLGRAIPILAPLVQLAWSAIIFIGIPFLVWEEATKNKKVSSPSAATSPTSTQTDEKGWHKGIRKILAAIFAVGLVLSFMAAFGSIFVFDGSDQMGTRYGIFWSAILLPITIIVAMVFSKKSILWYLLPILPLVSLIYFGNLLGSYIAKSNEEFCKQMIAENDRSVLDNLTSTCYSETHSGDPNIPANKKTTSWKNSYTSTQYGFSIKYPDNWTVTNNGTETVISSSVITSKWNSKNPNFSINVLKNANSSGDLKNYSFNTEEKHPIKTNIEIDGKNAIRHDVYDKLEFVIENGTDIVQITFPNQKDFLETYDAILSTLHFSN